MTIYRAWAQRGQINEVFESRAWAADALRTLGYIDAGSESCDGKQEYWMRPGDDADEVIGDGSYPPAAIQIEDAE